jgi:hypothetical protein
MLYTFREILNLMSVTNSETLISCLLFSGNNLCKTIFLKNIMERVLISKFSLFAPIVA